MATQKTPTQYVHPNDTIYLQDGIVRYGDLETGKLGSSNVGGNDLFYGGNADGEGVLGENYAVGDAPVLGGSARGGDDIFYGGNYAGGFFAGSGGIGGSVGPEALYFGVMLSLVGPQILMGGFEGEGIDSGNVFVGDALQLIDTGKGGADTLYGGINAANLFAGDAVLADKSARGGSDTLIGGMAKSEQAVNPYYDQDYGDVEAGYIIGDPTEDTDGDVGSLNLLYGDAAAFGFENDNSVIGGADKLTGGSAQAAWYDAVAINVLTGDAGYMFGHSTGGIDTLAGGNATGGNFYYQDDDLNTVDSYDEWYEGDAAVVNVVFGDGTMLVDYTQGGNDIITGGSAISGSAGYVVDGESWHAVDTIAINLLAGDGLGIGGSSHSGADVMTGGNATGLTSAYSNGYTSTATLNLMAGDTLAIEPASGVWLGNDKMTGGSVTRGTDGQVLNFMTGDVGGLDFFFGLSLTAANISGTLSAATSFIAGKYADLGVASDIGIAEGPGLDGIISGSVIGGNDTLVGGSGDGMFTNDGLAFWGGIGELPGGGDVDGSIINVMIGDATGIVDGGRGGFDTLTGGNSREVLSLMIGDALFIDNGYAGKDTLISGSGVDLMVGDAFEDSSIGAADRFIFRTNCNEDVIYDFNAHNNPLEGDRIDLSAFNTGRANAVDFKNYSALIASNRISDVDGGICIDLDINRTDGIDNSVTVYGIAKAELTSAMFIM